MGEYTLDNNRYAALSRQAAAEGCVLLKNENKTLPLRRHDRVAVFGRSAFRYYKSGLGSGGLVNTRYVVGILDALKAEKEITLDEGLLHTYEEWIETHPYDEGQGWGKVPWSQEEMEITDEMIQAAKQADIALVIIGRTAGEDQDNKNEAGSYLLTKTEEAMIEKVSKNFKRTAVILNVGNIIDMKWVNEYKPSAVLYAWQGGQEGGNAVLDVLTGRVTPCGKLTDTIAENIEDYPSTQYFGDEKKNLYHEDIYVGYRYFETFAKEKVLYPFGYGLSYTSFHVDAGLARVDEETITVTASVTNTGDTAGKEVVQVYVNAPQGKLGKPLRVLAGFAKTGLLDAGQKEELTLQIPKRVFASYDDSGVTGHKSCLVLEEGSYEIYVGTDVRSAFCVGSYEQEFCVLEQLEEACAPVEAFTRIRPVMTEKAVITEGEEAVPLRTVDPVERCKARREEAIAYTGDQGYRLADVYEKRITMEEFVAQLSDEELIALFHGEGMCSPKVTPGTAAAFGGLSEELRHYGIPAACCADGPSGIRMDCGTKAFSLPNGTALGCSFNLELIGKLYHMIGLELRKNRIDTLLGPGINIHRNPLNGRNFEYVSEDPLLTGKVAAAQLLGMEPTGSTGTIKHFATNNQEWRRQRVNAVVSERALREIYLKAYEIAVKEGRCRSIMTTYGPLNGIWTAGNYDLDTTILRKEWGFTGIVMTDWWAVANDEGEDSSLTNRAPMVRAQNDIYMVSSDAMDMEQDNVKECLESGVITWSDLQRNAANILGFILKSPAMLHEMGKISQEELDEMKQQEDDDVSLADINYYEIDDKTGEIVIDASDFPMTKGSSVIFGITVHKFGEYDLDMTMQSDLSELAQLPVSIYYDNIYKMSVSIQGTNGQTITVKKDFGHVLGKNHYVKLYFGADGLKIHQIRFKLVEEKTELPVTE